MSRKLCPNFSMVARTQRKSDGRWIMTRLRCKSWNCPVCVQKNRQMWNAHLQRQCAKIGGIWYFGTLTAPAWARTPEKSLAALRKNFDRFWKRLRRIFKYVEYARVYEVHKTGAFHLHLVVSGLAPRIRRYRARSGIMGFKVASQDDLVATWSIQTWFKKTAAKCKMGYIAEIKAIPQREAVRYITKYMTKEAQAFEEKGLRRVQASRGIGSPKTDTPEQWFCSGRLWGGDIGYQTFIDLDEKTVIPASYWATEIVYPVDNS